jgi:hypothetical protein
MEKTMSKSDFTPDPRSILEGDLGECRKLLEHCAGGATAADGSLEYRLAMMDRALRVMRLDVSLVTALARRDQGRLRASGHRAPQEKPARRRAERTERPYHYDYTHWLRDHPEEVARDEAAAEAKILAMEERQEAEKISKTTSVVGPRISVL